MTEVSSPTYRQVRDAPSGLQVGVEVTDPNHPCYGFTTVQAGGIIDGKIVPYVGEAYLGDPPLSAERRREVIADLRTSASSFVRTPNGLSVRPLA